MRNKIPSNPATKAIQAGASHSGFHFLSLYGCCPRKFYLKHILRYESPYTDVALLFGAAFHEGKAVWYTKQSENKAVAKAMGDLEARRGEFRDDSVFDQARERVGTLLRSWIESKGYDDLKYYKIYAVEEEIHIEVPGTFDPTTGKPYIATMRIDAILQDTADDEYYIFDTKTSQSSANITMDALEVGDQMTMYLWGAQEHYGIPIYGAIGDISYWNKNAKTSDNIRHIRTDPIVRSAQEIENFKKTVASRLTSIAQRTAAVYNGTDPFEAFPTNTYYCMAYFRRCEFADICRHNWSIKDAAPKPFKRHRRSKLWKPTAYVEDITSGAN